MSKHRPGKHPTCADADRAADEQIAMLHAEVARLNAELAWRRSHVCPNNMGGYWWQLPAPTTYPIITCGTTAQGQITFATN